jgi:hypothetical protein
MIGLLESAEQKFQSGLQAASQDPVGYFAGQLIEWGAIFAGIGVGLGILGNYAGLYANKAKGDAGQNIADVTSMWQPAPYNPPQAPLLSVTSANPAQDIANLGQDAYRLVSNFASDIWTGLTDIGADIDSIAKVIAAAITHGPLIIIDELIGLLLAAISDIFILIFPACIIIGCIMIAAGLVLKLAKWIYEKYVEPRFLLAVDHFIGQPIGEFMDSLDASLGIMTKPSRPAPMSEPSNGVIPPLKPPNAPNEAPAKPTGVETPLPPPSPPLQPTPPIPSPKLESSVSPEDAATRSALDTRDQVPAPIITGSAPVTSVTEEHELKIETKRETLIPIPTEDQEEQLGSALDQARDRMKAQMRAKDMAMKPRKPDPDIIDRVYSRIPGYASA